MAAIVQQHKRLLWLVVVVAVLLAVLTAGAFFTAEKPAEDYEAMMAKAIHRHAIKGELPVVVPKDACLAQRSISNEAEALAYAGELLELPWLSGANKPYMQYGKLRATEFDGEWRIDAPEAPQGFELYLSADGALLYFNECIHAGDATYPADQQLVLTAVDAYIRQFAKDCLGNPAIGQVRIDEQRYTLEQRTVLGRAMSPDGSGLFSFALEPKTMRLTRFMDLQRTTFGDGTVFSHAIAGLRNWVSEHTDIGVKDLLCASMTLEALDDTAICATFAVSADGIEPAFRDSLINLYGNRTVYRLESITDRYGGRLPYTTALGYTNRSKAVITPAAATQAAVKAAAYLFGTEAANITCSTADYIPDRGIYEAYCSYQPGNLKQLLILELDASDGSVVFADPAIVEGDMSVQFQQLQELPVPAAPLETLAPTPVPQPVAKEGISLTVDGESFVLPLRRLEGVEHTAPMPDQLGFEEAAAIAAEAVCREYGIEYSQLPYYYLRGQLLTEATVENTPKWWFNLVLESSNECRYTIGVSAIDGRVVDLSGPGDGNG